jgi:hypothetical protein
VIPVRLTESGDDARRVEFIVHTDQSVLKPGSASMRLIGTVSHRQPLRRNLIFTVEKDAPTRVSFSAVGANTSASAVTRVDTTTAGSDAAGSIVVGLVVLALVAGTWWWAVKRSRAVVP